MTDSLREALLPCPFCGNDKNIAMANEKHDHSGGYFIACPKCDASTGLRYALGDDPRPLLVEQWNRRALSSQAEPQTIVKSDNTGPTDADRLEWLFANCLYMPLHDRLGFQLSELSRTAVDRAILNTEKP